MNTENIAKKILQLRESKSMSQAELAELSNLSVSLISKIERNQVPKLSIDSLDRITSALSISLATFFNFETSYDIELNELITSIQNISNNVLREQTIEALISLTKLIQKK